MATNFDINFEKQKVTFKEKFGKDWNENIHDYLLFLQTLYLSSLTEISNSGFGQLNASIDEMVKKINNLK